MIDRQRFGRRKLLVGAGAAGLAATRLAAVAHAQTKPLAPVNIAVSQGLVTQIMNTMLKQQGIMEELGLAANIINVADGSKIVGGLLGGDLDLSTMSGFGQVFPAIERGGRLRVIGGAMLTPTFALYTSKANVQTLKDLEGKTIGSGSPGSLLHQLSVALLKKKGVDHKKVQFANIGSSVDVFRAVTVGTIDAGLGDATYMAEQEKYKVRLLPGGHLAEELTEYTFQGAYTTDRAIEAKRDTIVRALAGYAKLFRMMHKPEGKAAFFKAREVVAKKGSEAEGEIMWSYLQKQRPFAVNISLTEDRLDYMQRLNVEFGVQKSVQPFSRTADMSLARDAVKMIGGEV